ncbi:unnamed protein product [Pleuronectes platessa]|uniref:Uncharacterized protein n=1 Tax=Pleuronectes platessa TaxID=8262 RepID=A0A9N7UQ61_PLEPL|nr:unnamed protein product [Pleuronectes platessa]
MNGANVVTTSSPNPTAHCRRGEPASGLVDRDNYAPAHLLCHRTDSAASVAKQPRGPGEAFDSFRSSLLFLFSHLVRDSSPRSPVRLAQAYQVASPSLKSNLTVNSLRAGPHYRLGSKDMYVMH